MNPLLVKVGLTLLSRKLNSNPEDKQNSDFSPKELKKAAPIWLTVVTVILTLLSSKGIIDPAIYEAVTMLLSNPEVVEAIDSAVE